MPLTLALPAGLKQRHWEEINRITGLEIERTELTTMNDIASFHLENYRDAIEETCVAAVKEYGLEKALNAMEAVSYPCPHLRPHSTVTLSSIAIPLSPDFTLAVMGASQEWEGIEFTCKGWKDTGTYILSEIDEIQQLMDDQIVKTQAMRASR